MADGKQWYNAPQDGSSAKPNGKPMGSANNQRRTGAKPVQGKNAGNRAGVHSGKPGARPQGNRPSGNMKNGAKRPSGKKPAYGNQKKRPVNNNVNTFNGEKSIIPQMDLTAKPVVSQKKPVNKAPQKRPLTPQEKARIKEQRKIAIQAKRKEAMLKEQAKIANHEYNRKNPSQKSAESRAIRNGILGAVAVAAALFVLVFVIHHLYDFLAEKPNFSFVTTGSVEHTIGAKALIVRDETVINCTNTGELVTQITEGSRVAKGQGLAIVVPEEMKSVVQDLRNVQSQISDVQQELILAGGSAEADVIYRNYNKNLSSILDSVRFDAMGGNLSNMSSYGSSVNVILDEREDEMSKINFEDERITVLRNDEAVYEAQVEKYASVITADKPGIVSFRLDGKEQTLDYGNFLTMPAKEIKDHINGSVGAISSDLSVEENTPVVRIAKNENQYISVYLSSNDAAASDFAVGTLHDINVRTEGIAIDKCQVVRCEADASGMLITFQTSRCVEALLDLRTVDIEIVITETNGMRVSVPSLVNIEYAPKGNPCFCVYIDPTASASLDTFGYDAIFNLTILPKEKKDEEGNVVDQQNSSVGGCTVVYKEVLSDGGILVAFSTPSDYSNLLKLDKLYTAGYTASFVDTATGLGIMSEKIKVYEFSGIASVYTNKQGFVEEVRVLVLDNDREFAIIERIGKSSVPNLNTVFITNPKTVKPGDKVD